MSLNDFIEHETLLQSLSLEDKTEQQRWNSQRFQRSFNEFADEDDMDLDDDPMDIDEEPFNEHIGEAASPEHQGVTIEEFDTTLERDEHQNLLALLSPTMMGARLAISDRPKLLMPPSPKVNKNGVMGASAELEPRPITKAKHSIDYEFDVSSYPTVKNSNNLVPKRDISAFYNISNPNVFASASGHSTHPFSNESLNPHPIQPHPQMIHHHHYYLNGNDDNQTQLERMRRQYFNQSEVIELREKDQDSNVESRGHNASDLTHGSGFMNLPAPWRQDIHPIEKVPYIISSYLQLFINFIISIYFIYFVYYIVTSIKSDVNHKLQVQKRAIQAQIDSCRTLYYESKCDDPSFNGLPILRKKCETLARGMNQDPNSVGNLSMINAQIIGLVLNSLVEPLSFKFFMFLLWCGIVVFGCNFVFGFVRARTYYGGQTGDKELIRKHE